MGKMGPRDHVLCVPGVNLALRGWGAGTAPSGILPHPVGTGVLQGEPYGVDCLPLLGLRGLESGLALPPYTPSVAGPQAVQAEYTPTLPPAPDPVEDIDPGIVPWGLGSVPGRHAIDPHRGRQLSPHIPSTAAQVSLSLSFRSHGVPGPHSVCCNLCKSQMILGYQKPPGPDPGGRPWLAEGPGFLGMDSPRHRSELLC